ncbi:hypothetical protein [Burkholderia sp. RF2-non_BP3]|uniref:hypothetical protein n=1 Tax=Burkholderia sp. RF2-non_BP3 TaxID=1637844 RepID=UPI0007567FDB|nr:hypothetical protein [Burkholderia sp. RF2-non_BP3]KUY52383.1 hypothetical protein WS45_25015 [Burkholderia sp. RF2-non_BP3]
MIRTTSRAKLAYVSAHRSEFAAAAHWLLHEFDPANFVTLLTDTPEERAKLTSNAQALGKLFQKKGKRRRDRDVFEARVPRDLAEWFGGFSGWGQVAFRVARWWQVAVACAEAANRSVGAKRLDRVQLANRANGLIPREERHQRRLRVRDRNERDKEQWLREHLKRNNGSIL